MATKKAVTTTKKAVETKAEKPVEMKEEVKAAETAAVEAKPVQKKAAAKTAEAKPAAEKKAPAKKAPAKKTAVKEEVILQFYGKEIKTEELMKQVKTIWTKELKKKVGDMKSVSLYVKPEENAVYYVVNDDVTGKIEL